MNLRGYQSEGLAKIPESGACIIAWPTGAGKTVGFAKLAEQRGGRTLVLAHRDELISQACDKISQVWRGADIGVMKAERNETGHQVTVASVQSVSRTDRIQQWGNCDFNTCIIDEAHHATAPSYRRVIEFAQAPLTVGFTATPFRSNGGSAPLLEVFPQGIVHEKSILWMIQEGYLCNLRSKQVGLGVDLSSVKVRGGDFSESELGALLLAPGASQGIARAYVENASPRKALCFTASVAQAHEVAGALVAMGVNAAAVWGDQELEARRATLKKFSSGDLRVLVNSAVLLEGYDEPSIECVMVARPTLSKLLYTQMIGRGTRLYPGKSDCLILDFLGASGRHSLETMARMFSISERAAEAGIEDLLAKTTHFDPLDPEPIKEFGIPKGRLHWVPDGRRFLLSTGDAVLALVPSGLSWEIKEFPRGKDNPTRKLYAGLTLDYAQGVAEDLIRSAGSWALAAEGAAWRQAPPSPAQREIFAAKGWGEPRSRGAAADRMTVEFNRRRA